jgi:hypothetical protein
MKVRFLKILFVLISLNLTSCFFNEPAEFWEDYEDEFQTEHTSNQGPWGGRRIIHWVNTQEYFSKKRVIKYAEENGWKYRKDTLCKYYTTQTWMIDDTEIFPFHWKGFMPRFNFYSSDFLRYPRWIKGDITVLSFQTNYISIDLETQEEILINGYIILNGKQDKMTLYHSWGE